MIVSRVNTTASAASNGGSGPVTISYCPIGRHVSRTLTADRDCTPAQELPRSDTSGVLYCPVEGHQQYLRGTLERLNPIAGHEMPTKERRSRQ